MAFTSQFPHAVENTPFEKTFLALHVDKDMSIPVQSVPVQIKEEAYAHESIVRTHYVDGDVRYHPNGPGGFGHHGDYTQR